jgi:hypothetical protein
VRIARFGKPLATADSKLKKDGKEKAVEIGGGIWVYFHDWQMKK